MEHATSTSEFAIIACVLYNKLTFNAQEIISGDMRMSPLVFSLSCSQLSLIYSTTSLRESYYCQ